MYNEVEVKAILIAVHNIENVGLNSKKVLLNSIEWLRCQYEITQDESFLIKAVWHIYAYLELGYPYISGELEFNRILNCLQLDINTVFGAYYYFGQYGYSGNSYISSLGL